MNKSRIVPEQKVYVKFDDQGNTDLVKSNSFQPGFNYRRVHYTAENETKTGFFSGDKLFVDPEYTVDQSELPYLENQTQEPIVLKRLYEVYQRAPKNIQPQFFPPRGYIPARKLSSDPSLPPFITQLGNFPVEYYKSFFITQDFSKNGLYHIIINNNGRFETDVVDDLVPVRKYSLEPIWGMELDNAWQIIILKLWAKRNGGYGKIKSIPAFNFIEFFSNSNWKYYNLQKQGYDFLSFYTGRADDGKFILKTKNTDAVVRSGLIPNSSGYELISLVETTQGATNQPQASIINGVFVNDFSNKNSNQRKNTDRRWVATIRSSMNNKWSGSMSVLDKEINNKYLPEKYTMALQRDFMINETDFLNLFSTAYIASKRDANEQNYFSDYYVLQVEPNNKKSIYLRFNIPQDGWFDFCIKQFGDNRVVPSAKSRLRAQNENVNQGLDDGLRFLKVRFALVKENDQNSPSTFTEPQYLPPLYDTYEIENLQGYNRGDARFLKVVKGNYVLKIKPQSTNKASNFVLNYASNSLIDIEQYFPDKKTTSLISRQSLASLIGLVTSYHLDTKNKYEEIVFANVFEDIGYGFVGVRSRKVCPYKILIDVDPAEVQRSGYKIKNQFKSHTTPFSVFVSPGQSTSIVLKKIVGVNQVWPPAGIEIFKQK